MKPEPAAKILSTRKPIPGSTRVFILLFMALALGYLGRPPEQQLGTTGQGPGQIALGPATEEDLAQQDPEVIAAQEAAQAQAQAQAAGKKSTTKKGSQAGLVCAPGKNPDGTYKNGSPKDKPDGSASYVNGVSGKKIRLATTAVQDGPAASLLRYSPTGMKAVIDKVNSAGGICGRRLDLPNDRVVNDSFDAARGHQFLGNFLAPEADIFAFPVVPSAEGLSSAITSGDIQRFGMPVVGTDGMREEQYDAKGKAATVWPVAAATVSTMRIIAKYAYTIEAARKFAIVWDSQYKFGVEGKEAFVKQVADLGGIVLADVPLNPNQAAYASEVAEFNSDRKCGSFACDAVILLLLPDTAKNWLSRVPEQGRLYNAGAQTLFTDSFANDCASVLKDKCNGFAVWTGYNPPIGSYATLPGVAKYVSDVRRINPNIDIRNQFLQGAYFGMGMFVEALKKVGPNLTRAELKKALDALDYKTDMASDLSWRPGRHNANVRARAFSVVISNGKFSDWADEGTGFVLDPAFGG